MSIVRKELTCIEQLPFSWHSCKYHTDISSFTLTRSLKVGGGDNIKYPPFFLMKSASALLGGSLSVKITHCTSFPCSSSGQ